MSFAMPLIVIGLLALFGELFLPGGIAGIIGIGLIACGVLLSTGVSSEASAAGGILTSAVAAVVVYVYWRKVRRSPLKSGADAFVGLEATVITNFSGGKGQVRLKGEDWSARSHGEKSYKRGDKVKITGFEGVYLEVD
ncbi:MAG: NfeD family protein [Candidatus Micrarchaeota archaeon]|nr:NfeD family protein [Candidatus Micrarchaeota archaeon]